jgi:hypothetical protein
LSRDGSGNYSLPGATFPYIDGEIIQASELNNNLNDIASSLTQSVSKDGQTPMTGNLPMAGNKVTGLAAPTAVGQAVRYEDIIEATPLNVTSSGVKTIPTEGSMITITTAGVFNVTGFNAVRPGKIFTFVLANGITFTHSSTFQMARGVSRTFTGGEIVQMINTVSNTWVEIGTLKTIDMTGYAGADIALDIGQSAIYTITAVASLLLRIATGDKQEYDVNIILGSNGLNQAINTYQPNNSDPGGTSVITHYDVSTGGTHQDVPQANPYVSISWTCSLTYAYLSITTDTVAKTISSKFMGNDGAAVRYSGFVSSFLADTTTAITSLGTLQFVNPVSGRVKVTRKL